MPDSRLQEIAARAEAATRATDFTEIAGRGRRRRHARAVAGGTAAMVIAGVAVIGIHGVYADQSAPTPPAHQTVTQPTVTQPTVGIPLSKLTADQIVHSPGAQLMEMAVSPDDGNVMAARWQLCAHPSCLRQVSAVAVTRDGFSTSYDVKVAFTASVSWAAGEDFVTQTSLDTLSLVSPDDGVRPLRLSETASPLLPDEALAVRYTDVASHVYGVDVSAGTAHQVAVPAGFAEVNLTRAGQTLWGIAPNGLAIVSTDGGAHWQQHQATAHQTDNNFAIPSGDASLMSLVPAGDTLRTDTFIRSDDGGTTWQTFHPETVLPPMLLWDVVTPSGGLLIFATNQDAGSAAQPSVEAGVYASDGTDWTHFTKVPVHNLIGGSNAPALDGRLVQAVVDSQGRQWLYVLTDGQLLRSTDEGRTWSVQRDR